MTPNYNQMVHRYFFSNSSLADRPTMTDKAFPELSKAFDRLTRYERSLNNRYTHEFEIEINGDDSKLLTILFFFCFSIIIIIIISVVMRVLHAGLFYFRCRDERADDKLSKTACCPIFAQWLTSEVPYNINIYSYFFFFSRLPTVIHY